ncbi:hypothetical protein AYI69_g1859 [Smittium culicis]|uniref:Uncharacterized protein n=1 Tax=Smittium culicis TaxID=133412 RepID=A0A1R1YP91_9FUNG|nr:hypothetical protein AYI69_g1859 [Smittium culicis]
MYINTRDKTLIVPNFKVGYLRREAEKVIKYRSNFTEGLVELHRGSASNFSGSSPWTPNVTKAPRAKEHCIIYTEILDSHSYSNRTCNPVSKILERSNNEMECAFIPFRNSGAGDIYRLQRQCVGGGDIDAQQFKRATDDLICVTSQEEQKAGSLLQQVSGYQSSRDQRTIVQLASEGQMETIDSKFDYSSMEIGDMVPQPDEIINFPTASASGDNKLEYDGLEGQRRVLQEQGLSDLATDIFVLNEQCIKRKSKYCHV